MINHIEFENYKAFKKGKLKIKPITILLGANSAGKSSLIQLLLMLTQTFSSRKNRPNALQLNGELVKLGESKNIFHNKKVTSPIGLCFNISQVNYENLPDSVNDHIVELLYSLDRTYSLISSKDDEHSMRRIRGLRYSFSSGLFDEEDFTNIFSKLSSLKRRINIHSKDLSFEDFEKLMTLSIRNTRYRNNSEFYNPEEKKVTIDFSPLKHAFIFSRILKEFNPKTIEVKYSIKYNSKKKYIELAGFQIIARDKIILEYMHNRVRRGKQHILNSDIFDNKILNKYSSKFGNAIDLTNIEISNRFITNIKSKGNYLLDFLIKVVEQSLTPIKESLNYRNLNYISPLRAYPRRYYFQDEVISSSSVSTIDSIQLIDLFRERPDIKKRVNAWMKKFNINVDITQLEEVIHKIRINHRGLNLDITDVGFGISQVMPIIAQSYLARTNSVTLIEQPEIHLHPKMQAELADLFIETCKSEFGNKNFIIETHSEYLLKRLRRRISEKNISSDDVGLYFIHPKNDKYSFAKIEEIKISDSGDFKWPKDFYAEDLFDTIEFLKNQK